MNKTLILVVLFFTFSVYSQDFEGEAVKVTETKENDEVFALPPHKILIER